VLVGITGYFVVALTGWHLAEWLLPESLSGLGILLSLALAVCVLVAPMARQARLDANYTDAQVINRMFRVLDIAEALEGSITSGEIRLQLAKEVNNTADFFQRAYSRVPGVTRAIRKQRKRYARQCSVVLHEYANVALHGHSGEITNLRKDFARSILRVGSGNWSQVAHLNTSVQTERRFLDFLPSLDPKWIGALAGALTLQAVQIAAKLNQG
jgi:hypothetical protein